MPSQRHVKIDKAAARMFSLDGKTARCGAPHWVIQLQSLLAVARAVAQGHPGQMLFDPTGEQKSRRLVSRTVIRWH